MTREEARKAAEVMLAYANGDYVEVKGVNGYYYYCMEPAFNWSDDSSSYRVDESKPRYRPFKNKEECWNEMLKHQPFGWVKDKDKHIQIVSVFNDSVEFTPEEDGIEECITKRCFMPFKEVLDSYTFIDNSLFGIK